MNNKKNQIFGTSLKMMLTAVVVMYISYFASSPVASKLDSIFEFDLFKKLPVWAMAAIVFIVVSCCSAFIFSNLGTLSRNKTRSKKVKTPSPSIHNVWDEFVVESEISKIDDTINSLKEKRRALAVEKEQLRKERYASATKNCQRGEFFDYSLKTEKKA